MFYIINIFKNSYNNNDSIEIIIKIIACKINLKMVCEIVKNKKIIDVVSNIYFLILADFLIVFFP